MHYHGPIVRPQTDADSIFVEVTVGCTHNNCTILQAETKTLYAYNTTQFTDYDKYESSIFDPQAKAAYREEMFPKQRAAAYDLGKNLLV